MKRIIKLIFPLILAVLLLLVVRFMLVLHMRLPGDTQVRGFEPEQHVLVSLTYYGLRLPGEQLWGYHRLGYGMPKYGEPLVFSMTVHRGDEKLITESVGRCEALPGETVWIDPVRKKVLPAKTSPDAQPIVIPGRNRTLEVTPYNAHLLAYLMSNYEGCAAQADASGHLVVNGHRALRVRLKRDYYWIETQPDNYVIVPHDALIGKIVYQHQKKD